MRTCSWCEGHGHHNGIRCESCQGIGRVADSRDYAWILWTVLIAGFLVLAGLWLVNEIGSV